MIHPALRPSGLQLQLVLRHGAVWEIFDPYSDSWSQATLSEGEIRTYVTEYYDVFLHAWEP